MWRGLRQRQLQPEWMDAPDVDARELARSLQFIRKINTLLGFTRASISHLCRFSANWSRDQRITLLDVATGSADIPRAMLQWSSRAGFDMHITGIDRHGTTARVARSDDPRLSIVQSDALALPFDDGAFDYAHCAMFLHHLDDPSVVRVLREMDRVARRGVIVADLLRNRRAYAWIWALTLASTAMIRHDARVSVAQAFTGPEIGTLRSEAGLDYARFFRHFGHRFVLAGEKPRTDLS